MKNQWFEKFSQFLLDITKIVFTTLILGKVLTPSIINWQMFGFGIIMVSLLTVMSKIVFEGE